MVPSLIAWTLLAFSGEPSATLEADSNGIGYCVRHIFQTATPEFQFLRAVINFDQWRKQEPLLQERPITTGSHATLFGAALGYRRIALLGIDCNYVEKIDGAEERGGSVLELTADPKQNPNYFFDTYQRAGDKYNLPNSQPDLHVNSWKSAARALRQLGATVWNANFASNVREFPFRGFDEIELEAEVIGESFRDGRPGEALPTMLEGALLTNKDHFVPRAADPEKWSVESDYRVEAERTIRPEFDAGYYLRAHPEIKEQGLDPVEHYLNEGWRAGFDPSPLFSTQLYLQQNEDVRASGLNPYFHYLKWGRAEGRAAPPSVPEVSRIVRAEFDINH